MKIFQEYLEGVVPRAEGALDELLPPAAGRLTEAMRYSVFAGGKRIRPGLVVLAGEAFGAPRAGLLAGAAAMEMIHTFSLVHDDLPALDDDDLRRGRPTVHKQFDEALAILVGDALLNLGLLCLARQPVSADAATRAGAVGVVAEAVGSEGMIGGQALDLEVEASWPEDPESTLHAIHHAKTGALLTACLRLGGIYAGVATNEDRLLQVIGNAVGLLFQIGDDILDVESSTEILGKTAGKDERARKLTYPGLFGIEESRRKLAAIAEQALGLTQSLPSHREVFESLIGYLSERDR